ncbi:MAG: hypothetical protein DRP56_10730 [Planctomycetota bacterium]|nr:MAG: hypothetical protein DRP56_10730 [Planctomycetota bacterium]
MNILYICQHFYFPVDNVGARNFEFAKRWVQQGHNVTILTSSARLDKQTLESLSASGRFIKHFEVGGVKVAACQVAYRQEMSALRRCLSFALFAILSAVAALFCKKPDVIYASSTPLTVGLPALMAKWFRRIPYVFEVRDQWPESVIQVGILKNKLLIKMLSGSERCVYKHAAAIIALSEPMAEDVGKVAPPNKPIYSVPNCCDLDVFGPHVDGSSVRKENQWDDKVVFLHAGSMGKINSLDFVLYAAEKLRSYDSIHFVLIGKGYHKRLLEKQVQDLGLNNVSILPFIPKAKLPEYLAAADVIMPIIGNYPIIEKHASLNKFFDGLSAGKPMLLNYSGWQRKLVEDHQAGRGGQLCNLDEFVSNVLFFYNNSEGLKEYGENSRKIAEKQFSRDEMAAKALKVVLSAKSA